MQGAVHNVLIGISEGLFHCVVKFFTTMGVLGLP